MLGIRPMLTLVEINRALDRFGVAAFVPRTRRPPADGDRPMHLRWVPGEQGAEPDETVIEVVASARTAGAA